MVSFKFSFQPDVSREQRSTFEMAGLLWSQFLDDDITLNIHIAATNDLPSGVLGGAIPGFYADQSYQTIQQSLATDATSTSDQQAVANLSQGETFEAVLESASFTGDTLSLTRANAKALNISTSDDGQSLDGFIVLRDDMGDSLQWDYNFTRVGDQPKRTIDALSVAMHEIGHVLGFTSGLDLATISSSQAAAEENSDRLSDTTILDLFRHSDRSTPGVNGIDLGVGANASFSIDGGQTQLASFARGSVDLGLGTDGYQASHWSNTVADRSSPSDRERTSQSSRPSLLGGLFRLITLPVATVANTLAGAFNLLSGGIRLTEEAPDERIGIMEPTLAIGERNDISWVDLVAMDAIGYDLTPLGQFFVASQLSGLSVLNDASPQDYDVDPSATVFDRSLVDLLNSNSFSTQLALLAGAQVATNIATHTIDDGTDDIDLMLAQSDLYERRQRRRRRTTSKFFQESDDFQGNIDDIDDDFDDASFAGNIHGQVRSDIDQDGDLGDQDVGLEGVRIHLYSDFDQDGQEDGVPIASLMTDENGRYSFDNLVQGQYIVAAEDLEGFFSTADRNGYNPNRIAFINVRNSTITNQDFLDTPLFASSTLSTEQQEQGSIRGQVRNDQDQDGDLNDLDGGLVNVGVQLFKDFDQDGQEDGVAIATTQTNGKGEYRFDNLARGRYIVVAEDLEGYFSTGDRNGYNFNRIANLDLRSNNAILTGQNFLDSSFVKAT